ncbi:VanZ family protein [Winogradskyella schleiferi]|uniref:VanZ family protein n=1 Tax=Winogradskyella schleiferi TaxID=2686078 RepID=UPI0015B8B3D9|nr:VanZ family protein [Winogradskyella schleiferi]
MNKLLKGITIALVIFIFWIINKANKGAPNIFIEFSNSIYYGDKIGHFFIYGILTLLANLVFKNRSVFWSKNVPLGTVLVSIFVIVEELSQVFFPRRSLDIIDLIADALGILCFTLSGNFLFKKGFLNFKKSSKTK